MTMNFTQANPRILRYRRAVLALTAVVFLGIAVASLAAPQRMAEPFDYRLETSNALSEFRAIYVGLWLAHAVVLAWAAWRIDLVHLGDVAALLVLGQVVGRLASLVIDGAPDLRLAPVALAELLGGTLLLVLRPRTVRR
jgi:Domain of unknown function (DUF4345)